MITLTAKGAHPISVKSLDSAYQMVERWLDNLGYHICFTNNDSPIVIDYFQASHDILVIYTFNL